MLLEKVVIGSSVEAAYYALVNESYFIPTRNISPMFYEKLEVPILGTSNSSEAWSKLNILLGLLSKRIAPESLSNIRINEDSLRLAIDITTFKYKFKNLYIFDPTGLIFENEILEAKDKSFIVYDDFELSTLGPKRATIESHIQDEGFCKYLHFYCSGRVDGSEYVTDCVVESELTIDQLRSFEYSDSMVRFFVMRHLTDVGVYGSLMKYYKNGSPKYRKPKVVHVRRLVIQKDNSTYKDTSSVKFLNLSLEETIEQSTKR